MFLFLNKEKKYFIGKIRYIIGLDLSTVSSGMSLWDQEEKCLKDFYCVKENKEDKIYKQGFAISEKILEWIKKYAIKEEELLIAKEQQPLQYGKFTTISTLLAIAKVHGIVENFCYYKRYNLLDVPIATIRKNISGEAKSSKEDVYNLLIKKYPEIGLQQGNHDIIDSIAVCLSSSNALKNYYSNLIKEKKKEIKKYKSEKKIKEIKEEISCIEGGLKLV